MLIVAMVGGALPSMTGATGSTRVVIQQYGRFHTAGQSEFLSVPTTSGGVVVVSGRTAKFYETTRRIPCRLGETFGFTFIIEGFPGERAVRYRSEMHHPPIRQRDGSWKRLSVIRIMLGPGVRPPQAELWSFLPGFEEELVAGEWTRKIFLDDLEARLTVDDGDGRLRGSAWPPLERPMILGIRYGPLAANLLERPGQASGALIEGVFAGYPAAKAGLRPGDIVVGLAGSEVHSPGDLHDLIDRHAGQAVTIEVVRGRERLRLSARLWRR